MTELSPGAFRLTLVGPGVSLEKDVSQEIALAVLQMVLGGRLLSPTAGEKEVPEIERRRPRLSLREFLDGTEARTNPERISAFAAYLRDYLDQVDFSKDEVRSCFRSAGEPLPGNFSRDFQAAVQSGWVAEDHAAPGRFYLTRKGDEVIKGKSHID